MRTGRHPKTDHPPAVSTSVEGAPASAAHTPGPWRVAPSHHYRGGGLNIDTADSGQTGYICCAGLSGDKEAEANARLIAAAPDLLRELKNCVWLLADLQGEKSGLVQQQARAAIAKAEGR